ncbi:anthranilate synthase component I family protein [Fulvivirga sedimenti]|uniref:Anthranilate synthase component 1 n=1 Tax=Fulvivirga sedimenti TaxID=2879465 RepID=A0A9X1HMJ7_9BACT|nr:anthranilate synthase component I family protein [Fulvivirga sedimenti]MCA6073583.1 anthranilate synthase component I family protein [Fulvivirga sedimenti]
MDKLKFRTTERKLLADTITPVSIYLRLRDKFDGAIMLESSDYHGNENSFSYICCNPVASFEVSGDLTTISTPRSQKKYNTKPGELLQLWDEFKNSFSTSTGNHKFVTNGLFGYMTYDAVRFFEDVDIRNIQKDIPDMIYRVYRNVVVIDHFKNEMYLFDHQEAEDKGASNLDQLETVIRANIDPAYRFYTMGEERSNLSDEEFLSITQKGIEHCLRGDVFQIVLSRRFSTAFKGDEFNVYRALRSVNPSPYLFYFDYGNFKIFGSSPESQIVIKDGKASIWPIAGTFRRTGNDLADAELARSLSEDVKENAEHVMLVDLARNDLSRNAGEVQVDVFKEVQYYSHVIHLVSKVSGVLDPEVSPLQLVADTFPAGTLSGAPKHMAMQLIDRYENTSRNYYGGAIGFLGFNGDFNHAIIIRSFLSHANELHYQAGAGIVAKSVPRNELNEVGNKLAALRSALALAVDLNS